MYALPPHIDHEPRVTGLACPDCDGVLTVKTIGDRGALSFECRIGHTLATDEVLAAKEERLETRLWEATSILAELVQILGELRAIPSDDADRYGDREASARAQLDHIRRAFEEHRRLVLPGDGMLDDQDERS